MKIEVVDQQDHCCYSELQRDQGETATHHFRPESHQDERPEVLATLRTERETIAMGRNVNGFVFPLQNVSERDLRCLPATR